MHAFHADQAAAMAMVARSTEHEFENGLGTQASPSYYSTNLDLLACLLHF